MTQRPICIRNEHFRIRLRLALGIIGLVLSAVAPASACGRERWSAKVLADGTTISASAFSTSVDALRALPRPYDVSGFDAPRVPAERRLYRVDAELLGFKLESDGDIHLVIAQPGNRARTMIAEIPDQNCMDGAPAVYVRDVEQARLQFVKSYGIPPVRTFRLAYRPITLTGPAFFDFLHGQDGLAPTGIEIHPVLAVNASSATAPSPSTNLGRPASTNKGGACPGDVRVWVNTRSGIYHLPGSRWYGTTRHGEFMCRKQADADGYRAALNGD